MVESHETSENDIEQYETFEKGVQRWTEFDANLYDDLIMQLEGYKGKDTKSMISLMIPPSYQLSKVLQYLENELRTFLSNNIEEGNCHSFLRGALANRPSYPIVIKHAMRRLKDPLLWYPCGGLPRKGVLFYCGLEVDGDKKKEYIVKLFSEAPMPVKEFFYICDNKFYVESFKELNCSWKLHVIAKRYEIFHREIEYPKRVIELIDHLKGKGSKSMISLIIPSNYQISSVVQLLEDELRTSNSNEGGNFHFLWKQDGANRRLIKHLIRSFKRYCRVPRNGLVRFTGLTTYDEHGKLLIDDFAFEPLTPMKDFLYERGDRFHMEVIKKHMESWKSYVAPYVGHSESVAFEPYRRPSMAGIHRRASNVWSKVKGLL